MSNLSMINSSAQSARSQQALAINIGAGQSLQNVVASNLGPRGTLKMLVSGAGDIKITKDGNVLLKEMAINHPTAALIARVATSQDQMTGDGTTSIVLFTGELLTQSKRYLVEGMHPSAIVEGFEIAKNESKKFLEDYGKKMKEKVKVDDETLINVAKTALRTKLAHELADKLAADLVEAIKIIKIEDKPLDLFMVEIQSMEHKLDTDTTLVRGLVLDHGPRHPDMRTKLKNCHILTCNVSMEYEKTEINSQFMVTDPKKRQELLEAERATVDDRVKKVIELKKEVCGNPKDEKNFVVINQKGIDPLSLDMFAKAGITALRRAKRRNMERLTLACGGIPMNSVEDLDKECLGYADDVHEVILGEEKYTFVEGVKNPHSCTILIRASNKHAIQQIKDAIRDGLRAIKNAIEDECVIPGAGAFEVALSAHLQEFSKKVKGKAQVGVKCFADALLIIPKVLAKNSGLDALDAILNLEQENESGNVSGLDIFTGDAIDPIQEGIFDNFIVKKQFLESSAFTASQLLYVDEILSAGKSQKGGEGAPQMPGMPGME
eukprot:gene9570-1773_t